MNLTAWSDERCCEIGRFPFMNHCELRRYKRLFSFCFDILQAILQAYGLNHKKFEEKKQGSQL